MRRDTGLGRDLVKGAIAGAVATWVMDQATTWMYEREGEQARDRENQARGDTTAYETAATSVARTAGVELSPERR